MLAFWVVEKLDLVKHVVPSLSAIIVGPAPDPFPLEELEDAFHDSIIMTVAPPAHAGCQIVGLQQLLDDPAAAFTNTILGWVAQLVGRQSHQNRIRQPAKDTKIAFIHETIMGKFMGITP